MGESRQIVIITTNRKHYRKNNDYVLSQLSHLIECVRESKQEIKYSTQNIEISIIWLLISKSFLENKFTL